MRGHWRGAPMESLEIVDLTFLICLKKTPAGWGSTTPLLCVVLLQRKCLNSLTSSVHCHHLHSLLAGMHR